MNKLKILVITFIFSQAFAFANYNDIFIADIQYDWISKSEVEKEALVSEVKDIIFEKDTELPQQKDLRSQFKEKIKDKNYKEHYFAASAGYKEYKDYNISAFYYKNQKHIYMYALQDKKDITKTFYYSALGKLVYIDYNFGEYPEYPYYTIQYSLSGKPISAIYYVSRDNQYLFNPDGSFEGIWYKHNLYNKESKIILTRTAY